MITNLFSVFDPATGALSLNWLSIILILTLPLNYWNRPNKTLVIVIILNKKLMLEIIAHIKNYQSTIIFVRIFIFIFYNNIIGLLPYIFTASSQLPFSVTIAISIWISLIIFGWINKTNHIFCHLVPVGTPYPLIPFMVVIESIRNLIRPISLAVRLTANIIAGHLLISLLGNNLYRISLIIMIIWLFIGLIVFEIAVAFIQSYVFITLSTLYYREI